MYQEQRPEQRMSFVQNAIWLFRESDFELAQVAIGLALLAWPLFLLSSNSGFGVSTTYQLMAARGSEQEWSMWTGGLFALFTVSAVFRWYAVHALTLLAAFLWWSYVISMFWRSAHDITLGICIHAGLVVIAALVFLRYMAKHDVLGGPLRMVRRGG